MTRTGSAPACCFTVPVLNPGDYAAWYKHVTGEWVFDLLAGQITNRRTGRLVAFRVNDAGYLAAEVVVKGVRVQVFKHRAVWIAAHGLLSLPPDLSLEVDLINHVKTDCRLANLRLVRSAETGCGGNRHFTAEEVREIRRIYAAGSVSMEELAGRFGASQRRLARLVRGMTYRGVCDV